MDKPLTWEDSPSECKVRNSLGKQKRWGSLGRMEMEGATREKGSKAAKQLRAGLGAACLGST